MEGENPLTLFAAFRSFFGSGADDSGGNAFELSRIGYDKLKFVGRCEKIFIEREEELCKFVVQILEFFFLFS